MRKKALVVDRDFFFVEFMEGLLTEKGYEVVKAYNGKEGMQALDSHRFDLMFSDIVMTKVDGWQLIHYARHKFPDHPFPIVAISGSILEQLDGLEAFGADFYITKGPLDKMLTLLNDFLDTREARPFPDPSEQRIFDLEDIYPRRESMALIESLKFQRAVAENIGIGIFVVDTDGRVLNANPRALAILDRTEMEVLNRPLPSLFPPEERSRVIRELMRVAREPELRRNAFSISLNSHRLHMVASLLAFEKKAEGWVVAIEELEGEKVLDGPCL